MNSQDIKNFLEAETGISEKNWKRLSKNRLTDGNILRTFKDKKSNKTLAVVEHKSDEICLHYLELAPLKTFTHEDIERAKLLEKNHFDPFETDSNMLSSTDGLETIPSLFIGTMEPYEINYLDNLDINEIYKGKTVTPFTEFAEISHNIGLWISYADNPGTAIDDGREDFLTFGLPDWMENSGTEGMLSVKPEHNITVGEFINEMHKHGLKIDNSLFGDYYSDFDGPNPFKEIISQMKVSK